MPFRYNPPTRTHCSVCERLHEHDVAEPVIDSHNGKASSANNFPFHNWYNFVLGYTPEFPEYMLDREEITTGHTIVDPFAGSGTTLICSKMRGIPSVGIDANDFMAYAASIKLNWGIDLISLRRCRTQILERIEAKFNEYKWDTEPHGLHQLSLLHPPDREDQDYRPYVQQRRPEMLVEKYISDKPFARASLINDIIQETVENGPIKDILDLALTSIILPISNVKYGPGFGVSKPKSDVDVLRIFATKLNRMIQDLEPVADWQRDTPSEINLGDARQLSEYIEPDSADLMITSPPYPGDHEYTKHTRLELIFKGFATNQREFRAIKQRMLRASTTNIYRTDNDREHITDLESIQVVTKLIRERLDHDGATSGFEKLYTKLVWEYFGGMYITLQECFRVLRPGGKIALLVSDSHAFKMVHIQTAAILQEIAERLGYVNPEIVLWQLKTSTSHNYNLRENILILTKP